MIDFVETVDRKPKNPTFPFVWSASSFPAFVSIEMGNAESAPPINYGQVKTRLPQKRSAVPLTPIGLRKFDNAELQTLGIGSSSHHNDDSEKKKRSPRSNSRGADGRDKSKPSKSNSAVDDDSDSSDDNPPAKSQEKPKTKLVRANASADTKQTRASGELLCNYSSICAVVLNLAADCVQAPRKRCGLGSHPVRCQSRML